jgi:hypothetical protein
VFVNGCIAESLNVQMAQIDVISTHTFNTIIGDHAQALGFDLISEAVSVRVGEQFGKVDPLFSNAC